MQRRVGMALVAVSAISFGCLALFGKIAQQNGVETPMLLFLRFTTASLIMLGVLKVQALALPEKRHIPKLMLLGFVYVGQALCFFTALEHVTAMSLVSLML